MSTQNNNFQWRPNDNSVTTNLRYDLEMNHWLKSLRSSSVKSTFTISPSLMVVGLIISLLLNIIFFVLICISNLLVWLVNIIKGKVSEVDKTKVKTTPMLSTKKLDKMWESRRIIKNDTS